MSVIAMEVSAPRVPVSKPRLWTAFVLALAVFVGGRLAQLLALFTWGLCRGIWLAAHGVPGEQLGSMVQNETLSALSSPAWVLVLLFVPFQLCFGLAAVLAALPSAEPLRARLGLVRPALPGWGVPLVAVGSLALLAMGVALACLLVPLSLLIPSFDHMSLGESLAVAFFFAVVPPVMEELFFRGFVQRRLLKRWPPAVAILVTAALFAAFHASLLQMVFTFVLGIWLGVLAWRTGSVWPSMVCHGVWNAAVYLWGVGNRFEVLPETLPLAVRVAAAGLVLGCFLLSVWALARRQEGALSPAPEGAVPAAA